MALVQLDAQRSSHPCCQGALHSRRDCTASAHMDVAEQVEHSVGYQADPLLFLAGAGNMALRCSPLGPGRCHSHDHGRFSGHHAGHFVGDYVGFCDDSDRSYCRCLSRSLSLFGHEANGPFP
jgi:hypothetical protein